MAETGLMAYPYPGENSDPGKDATESLTQRPELENTISQIQKLADADIPSAEALESTVISSGCPSSEILGRYRD
jgi:hypothetical protein